MPSLIVKVTVMCFIVKLYHGDQTTVSEIIEATKTPQTQSVACEKSTSDTSTDTSLPPHDD